MAKLGKYLLYIVMFISIVTGYILTTDMGNKLGYFYLSDTISEKARLNVKVLSLNLYTYPTVSASILIEEKYTLNITGEIENFKTLDMHYNINSICLETNYCAIDDIIEINGTLTGEFRNILIQGSGKILDGNISYEGLKKRHTFENLNIRINDINSSKLLELLGEKAIMQGQANATIHFDTIGKHGKQGTIDYEVVDKNFFGLHTKLTMHIGVKDDKQTFDIHLNTPTASIDIVNGTYNRKEKLGSALYVIDIKELADLENVLQMKAKGPFYSYGNINYDKKVKIQGLSKSFGGTLDIFYENKAFLFYLNDMPFNNIMQRLSSAPLLDAKMQGILSYDLRQKEMTTKVTLKEVTFLQKDLIQLIDTSFGYKLNEERFDDSHFEATYKDKTLSSFIKIANEKNYFSFTDTKLDSIQKSINTHIDFKVGSHSISGKLYARHDGSQNHTLDTYLIFDGLVEKFYALKLTGPLSDRWINMDYSLSAARCPSHVCTIVDDINVTGHLYGPYKRLFMTGSGKAINGDISFDGVKEENTFKNIHISMKNIHARKLSTLMGFPTLPHGKATLEVNLQHYNNTHKKGTFSYSLKNGTYETLPLGYQINIDINDDLYTFTGNIQLDNAKIDLTKGLHDANKQTTHAFYTLDVKNLTPLEPLIGYEYKGSFYAMGTVDYLESYKIHGLTKTLGGLTEFAYENEKLNIDLKDVSFKSIMNLFPYQVVLDANTTGNIKYDFIHEKLNVKTNLTNAKFLHTKMVDDLYKKAGVNILYETFSKVTLDIQYQNNILLGNLIMDNEANHVSLTNTRIDTKLNTVNAYFDFKVQGKEFSGKVYGSLDNPKVNLDMQKLIQHEMDRQLDSIIGKGNREMMESMPMGGVAKDMTTGMGGAFMGIFF